MKEDIQNQKPSVATDEKPVVVRKSLRVRTNVHAGPGGPVMPIITGTYLK